MSRLYEEYALISIETYNFLQKIIENKLDDLDKKLVNIILKDYPDLESKNKDILSLSRGPPEEPINPVNTITTEEPRPSNNVASTSDYSHMKPCFDNKNQDNTSTIAQKTICKRGDNNSSVLDNSKDIKKQQLLLNLEKQIEQTDSKQNENSELAQKLKPGEDSTSELKQGRSRQTASKEDLRRSKRHKKTWQTLKH